MTVWGDVDPGLVKALEGVFDVDIVREWLKVCTLKVTHKPEATHPEFLVLEASGGISLTPGLDLCPRAWACHQKKKF